MSKVFIKHLEDNIEFIGEIKDNCWSLGEICKHLGYSDHSRNTSKLNVFCISNNIDITHFTSNGLPRATKYIKTCLHCGKEFKVSGSKNKEQRTCSHKCANTYFKPNKKDTTSNTYIFAARQAGMVSCAICGESTLVDIHHIDHDRNNNNLDNLVPLCPTHHMYLHRGKADLIMDKLIEYLDTRVIGE